MNTLTENNTRAFYTFLKGDLTLPEIEAFVYAQTDLEQQLDEDVYSDLISFDFKDKKAPGSFREFTFRYLLPEGEFETRKLKLLLSAFLAEVGQANNHLQTLYTLYNGTYREKGPRKYRYKFLASLGLNYLHWLDEGYLKTSYGAHWEKQYEKGLEELPYYHAQLKPFAEEILKALNNLSICILNDGTYTITKDLTEKLESGEVYQLRHPGKTG